MSPRFLSRLLDLFSQTISTKLTVNKNCFSFPADGPRSRSYQSNRRANQQTAGSHGSNGSGDAKTTATSTASSSSSSSTDQNNFRDFLWQHVELAQLKGFDDNVGRNPVPAIFVVRPSYEFFSSFGTLIDLLICLTMHVPSIPLAHTFKYMSI